MVELAGTPAPITRMLVEFAHRLRDAGLTVGSGDVLAYSSALACLDPTDLVDLYWSGRTAMLTRHEQGVVYDREFKRFFLDEAGGLEAAVRATLHATSELASVLQVPATEPGEPGRSDREAELGLVASAAQVLRHKDFASCTPDETAALRRIMARIRLTPPRRRTRRSVRANSGPAPDLRRTLRETMRRHGEPAELYRRRRALRLRPMVLLLDVSGSMSDYSRSLLQFAHTTARAAGRVEVFCFATHLTRITPSLKRRRTDDAMAAAARVVAEWEGGTRIGYCLDRFVRDFGRRGMGRGGIVLICSDGLDRGDPQVLAAAMERLARLCHRVVWVNPHRGTGRDYRPDTLGMMVAAPYVDELVPGHDLRSLEQLAILLPTLA